MIKYFCDVCGAETAGGDNTPSSWAAELCGLADLCPRCEGLVGAAADGGGAGGSFPVGQSARPQG